MATVFLRLLAHDDKQAALAQSVDRLRIGETSSDVHLVDPESFRQVPGSPFAYWVSENVRKVFTRLLAFEGEGRTVRVGLQTNDDFRWLRLCWEVSPFTQGRERTNNLIKSWVPFAKGGSFARYYSDIHLVVEWTKNGEPLKLWKQTELSLGRITANNSKCWNESLYFEKGLTWTPRTLAGLAFRIFNQGAIFAHKGPVATILSPRVFDYLGIMNSRAYSSLVDLQMAFGSFEAGIVQRTPIPNLTAITKTELADLAYDCFRVLRNLDRANEVSHVFHLPALAQASGYTIHEKAGSWQTSLEVTYRQLTKNQQEIDDIAFRLYGIVGEDRTTMEMGSGLKITNLEETEEDDSSCESVFSVEGNPLVAALMSYATGCVVGRWDIRFANGERPTPELPDSFDPLPVCPPGMLQDEDGLPLQQTPVGYPFRIDWDGILVDDSNHSDDIVRRVRDVLELIWKDRSDTIEREVCEILGVKELREYFRRSGNGGFWTDHVSRYSKSRRKAPIYWLLQSARKNYALWIYYHRLDKDILFKALLNYVEPKIRSEESRLDELRSQKLALGPAAKGVKNLEKDIDRQETFLSELRDFEDKLRRAANLHLDPDLNDGVVLNIAPLRELIPWKEAKSYWDELIDGKYEWSSIGKQLREKGLVP